MKPLGLIDADRLALIPPQYWREHEYCFFLHDRLLETLIQYDESGAHRWVTDAFDNAMKEHGVSNEEIDVLGVLQRHGLVRLYQHHIVSHLVLGLTSDMLHFLYEALMCFEKRKFAVAFALLRKPLKENLLFLCWLLGNESDFISRFEKDNYSTLNGVTPERRSKLFADAIARLATKEAFAADLIDQMIFSKEQEQSFEPIWQRATHLITSQGAMLRTEDLNINFIFHDAQSDDLFELLYSNLPYLILFASQVALACFSRIVPANKQTASYLILVAMGAFECLFRKNDRAGVTKTLTKHLKPFLTCIHCASPIRVTRDNAIGMYLREAVVCRKCGSLSQFPLYWLLAQAKVTVLADGTAPSILDDILAPPLGDATGRGGVP